MAFGLCGPSSLVVVFLVGIVAVNNKVWLNEINSPPQASLSPPSSSPPLYSLRFLATASDSPGFGFDLGTAPLDPPLRELDLLSGACPHLLPFNRWLFRHLCLVASLM
jgi:hypothetical protein